MMICSIRRYVLYLPKCNPLVDNLPCDLKGSHQKATTNPTEESQHARRRPDPSVNVFFSLNRSKSRHHATWPKFRMRNRVIPRISFPAKSRQATILVSCGYMKNLLVRLLDTSWERNSHMQLQLISGHPEKGKLSLKSMGIFAV